MCFSVEWESIYKDNRLMCIWPWSDLVGYVYRYVYKKNKNLKVLELGCGAGSNIPFFLELGYEYYGLDGSKHIVNYLRNKFPQIKNKIKCTDFTIEIPFRKKFDLIVDRASITHNTTNDIINCVKLIHNSLNPGGYFIGIDWFSKYHSSFKEGEFTQDRNTKFNFKNGQFTGLGKVHFSDKKHLEDIFKNFQFISLEHKILERKIPNPKKKLATWNFIARKR